MIFKQKKIQNIPWKTQESLCANWMLASEMSREILSCTNCLRKCYPTSSFQNWVFSRTCFFQNILSFCLARVLKVSIKMCMCAYLFS